MKKYVKFSFDDNRVTYLWPDHPLVLAGNQFLQITVKKLEQGCSKGEIVEHFVQTTEYPFDIIEGFVKQVVTAIDGMHERNIANTEPPGADNLAMATINLTKDCNLRCTHCYVGDNLGSKVSEMTIIDLENVITQLSALVVRQPRLLIFSGGEPLLQKEKLRAGVLCGRKHNFGVRVNTNGLLVDHGLAQFFADNQVLVQVSLDGPDAKMNALLRGSDVYFDKAIAGIRALVNAGCRTRISTTIHSENVQKIPAMIELAETLGVEQFTTSNLVGIGNAQKKGLQSIGFANEFIALYAAVKGSQERQKMTRSTLLAETITAMRAGIRFVYCGTGCSTLCVDANGKFYPCINMIRDEFSFGKIVGVDGVLTLSSLWYNADVLKGLRRLNVNILNSKCSKCVFRHFCGGYCRGETLAGGGKINSQYVRCSEWKRGLIKVMDILSQDPDIYDFGTDPLLGVKHRE